MKIYAQALAVATAPTIKDVEFGECFNYNGMTYMRCMPRSLDDAHDAIVVCLLDGAIRNLSFATAVEPLNSELSTSPK